MKKKYEKGGDGSRGVQFTFPQTYTPWSTLTPPILHCISRLIHTSIPFLHFFFKHLSAPPITLLYGLASAFFWFTLPTLMFRMMVFLMTARILCYREYLRQKMVEDPKLSEKGSSLIPDHEESRHEESEAEPESHLAQEESTQRKKKKKRGTNSGDDDVDDDG